MQNNVQKQYISDRIDSKKEKGSISIQQNNMNTDKRENTEMKEKIEISEKTEKTENTEKTEKTEMTEMTEMTERAVNAESTENAEMTERKVITEGTENTENAERTEYTEKTIKPIPEKTQKGPLDSYTGEIPEKMYIAISEIEPYEKNPRDNTASIDRVANSIRSYGFLQPIVCDNNGVILAGHTRYAAARKLGLEKVPVIVAGHLDAAKAREYRLVDNKAGEDSKWLEGLLHTELKECKLQDEWFHPEDFGFPEIFTTRRQESWTVSQKKCNMQKRVTLRSKQGFWYTSFFGTSKEGRPLDEIKQDTELIEPFALNLCDYLLSTFGDTLCDCNWCIITAPRRRHKEGLHFATEICRLASKTLNVPFYEDCILAENRDRLKPKFQLQKDVAESNVILYDDILTTGCTLAEVRRLLLEKKHTVYSVVAIRNGMSGKKKTNTEEE